MIDTGHQDPDDDLDEHDKRPPIPELTEADLHYPYGAGSVPAAVAPPPTEKPPKPPINKTLVFAVIGTGLGLLVGIAIAAQLGRFDRLTGPYDLGSVNSSADGLNGHLFTEWDGKLEYRLTITPVYPQQRAGFALAVTNSPRPISFDIQLKDPVGFVLCGKNILLKFDPTKPQALAAAGLAPGTGQTNAANASLDHTAQAIELARLESQELDREHGKDIFQNDLGKDGEIESISAQGDLSCSRKASENAVSWSFTSSFPSFAEQDDLAKPQAEAPVIAAGPPPRGSAPRRKAKTRTVETPAPYFTEGDDAIVEFDVSRGIIGTSEGRFFFIDRKIAEGAGAAWQDFPVRIHYTCEQASACTLMHAGLGALHVRMTR